MPQMIDLTGQTFGRLTVTGPSEKPTLHNGKLWRCLCACGNEKVLSSGHLRSGNTRSCGCLRRETTSKLTFSHGESRNRKDSTELRAYKTAKRRCNDRNFISYKNYGGRGIRFKFKSFQQFLKEIGRRPAGKTLDRKNNDGHYEPGNIRWATRRQQALNRRLHINQRSHCKKGHPFSPENTYIWHGDRRCKTCDRARQKTYRLEHKK